MKNVKVFSSVVLLLALAGCRSGECASSATDAFSHSRNEYARHILRDSIVMRDSIIVRERADTVFLTKYSTLVKERVRVDTIVCRDTLFVEREVIIEHVPKEKRALFIIPMVVVCSILLLLLCYIGLPGKLWNFILKCVNLCIRFFRLKQ